MLILPWPRTSELVGPRFTDFPAKLGDERAIVEDAIFVQVKIIVRK